MALSITYAGGIARVAQHAATDRGARLRAIFADDAAFVVWYDQVMPRVYAYLFSRRR